MNYPINNVQTSITLAAAQKLMSLKNAERRQVWSVPAGHGKSRIILALVVLLYVKYNVKQFLLVYNHSELKEEDEIRLRTAQEFMKNA